MKIKILLFLFIGILIGRYVNLSKGVLENLDTISEMLLISYIFFIGIFIAKDSKAFSSLKENKTTILILPIISAIASIFGSIVVAKFFGIKLNYGAAIGAGFGWYSISAILIGPYSQLIATIAFLTNIIREIFALLIMKMVSKISRNAAISIGGAASMDVCLGFVTKYCGSKYTIPSLIHGIILSILVPILVEFFMKLN